MEESRKPKWKTFEELVARIQGDLAGDATIISNDKIVGKRTGVPREIDVSIRKKVGQFEILIVIDCKDYAKPLDVKDVEEFMGLAQDVGAHKAAMVSAQGYSAAAKMRAQDAGIELYRVLDSGHHPWRVESSLPAVCEMTGIRAFSLTYAATGFFRMRTDIDHRQREIFDRDRRSLGKIGDLLHGNWNEGKFPRQPGTYRNLEFAPNPVLIETDGEFYEMNIRANLVVESRLYFGNIPLKEITGFHNELTGESIVKNIETESVEFAEIERSWPRINAIDEVAVKPVVILRCFDVYGARLG